ncbi:hypothetical protein [Vibrio parahaemolyticus]|nr:hypothetical protein [Vibrio parahaemolyticus]
MEEIRAGVKLKPTCHKLRIKRRHLKLS